MMKRLIAAVSLAGLLFSNAALAADKYDLDLSHSQVGFAVKHMVISTVKGKFNDYSGFVMYDDKDITKSSVEFTVKVASIDTDNEKRDNHLKSPDFFEAEKFPTITFKSKKITKKGDLLSVVGDLTVRDVTKEVEVPFVFNGQIKDNWGNTRIGADATFKINRQDYGVKWSQKLDTGGLVVSDDVTLEIHIEAILPGPKKN